MKTSIARANREIAAGIRHDRHRRREQHRLDTPIRLVDSLIADLEEMQLLGQRRVPAAVEPRLREIADAIGESQPELRSGITIVHLMDALFSLQEKLLERRTDRAAYGEDDEDAPGEL